MVRMAGHIAGLVLATTMAVAAASCSAIAEPGHDTSIDAAAAKLFAARLGAMRGPVESIPRPLHHHDAMTTRSVRPAGMHTGPPAPLPTLPAFSGPVFVLIGEPVARPMPDRPVRIVYGGQFFGLAADRW